MEAIGTAISLAVASIVWGAVVAWFTILPAIGILFLTGYLN